MAFKLIPLKKTFIWMLVVAVIFGTLPGGLIGARVSAAGDGIRMTYNGNGANSGDVPVDPVRYSVGDLAIVRDNSNGLKREGYEFAGWNTKADGTGEDYLPGQIFTLGMENVTLYAKWIDPYTIWINRQVSSSQAMNDVAYLGGRFFGVGADGLIAVTVDGMVWTRQESGVDKELHDITDGNGRYVAVGADGTILLFGPDAGITRAEFAAIIVRALGLKPGQGPGIFADVNASDEYSGHILTAHEYGLMNGYADGSFRPNEEITRKQAMVILARATAIAGLKAKLPAQSADITLGAFSDACQVSGWAIDSVALTAQAGVVYGRTSDILDPLGTVTKVEAAAMIERLLRNSDLI